MRESSERPEINLDGVFYPEKIETSERSTEGIRNGIIISAEMDGSAWTHVTNCKKDVEGRTNFVSIDLSQLVNKSDDVASSSTIEIEKVKELVSFVFLRISLVLKLYLLTCWLL